MILRVDARSATAQENTSHGDKKRETKKQTKGVKKKGSPKKDKNTKGNQKKTRETEKWRDL